MYGYCLSHPIGCPDATAAYYTSPYDPAKPAEGEAAGAAAKAYAAACIAEAKIPESELPLYATTQAIEDLEAIRDYLGVDKLDLYGESYGTQLVQTYAAAYPQHIRTLYLDGPVDLTLDGPTYLAEAARAFDDALVATLTECAARPECLADFEGQSPSPPTTRRREAEGGPIRLPDGRRNHPEAVVTGATSRTPHRRRTACSTERSDPPSRRPWMGTSTARPPRRRLADHRPGRSADPDPAWSDAYYAVECQDYVYQADEATDADRLRAYLDAAETLGVTASRLPSIYYGDMPCLYWPNRPTEDPRPAAIVDAPYPTWIMVATADPITPPANAMRLAARLHDVHVIVETGGPHVIFGWGLSCPDDVVADYLVKGGAREPDHDLQGGVSTGVRAAGQGHRAAYRTRCR
jgi:pimeloyl-ACP methyl ester carboxylesterase